MAGKSLKQRYSETRSDFFSNEEKAALAAAGTVFSVDQVEYGTSVYGRTVQLRVTLDGKVRWMTFSDTPSREQWMTELQTYIEEEGPAMLALKRIQLSDDREYFDVVPV